MASSEDATPSLLRKTREGAVQVLTLDRPDANNALCEPLRQEIIAALREAEADPEVRAILVTANGRNFCAGADIRELDQRTTLAATWAPQRLDVMVENVSKPIVAALHGHVLGGGLELSLAFTIRLAASNLKAGFPEVKLGIFPALGGTQRLPRLVGEGRAMELLLTGRTIDADEALRIGLVTEVVALDQLHARALALATTLAAGPPVAMRVIIEATRRASDLGRNEGLDYERRLFGVVCSTEDKAEGVRAWLEKRPPVFTGR